MNIAENIRRRMEATGMNRQQLANAANMTWANVARIVSDEAVPRIPTLERIAAALGCTVAELVE